MVEAAIVIPVVILIAVLLLRLFIFYLEILVTGVSEHELAIEVCNSYEGKGYKKYENERVLTFAKGGLLAADLNKTIKTEAIMCNEDELVRIETFIKKNK